MMGKEVLCDLGIMSAIATHVSDARKVPQIVIWKKCELYRDSFHIADAVAVHKEIFH